MGVKLYYAEGDLWKRRGNASITTSDTDWSDENPPWAYTSESEVTEGWPEDTNIMNLSTTGATFADKLQNTINAAGGRVVVRLPAGVHHLTEFKKAGSGNDPSYGFGYWHPNIQGLIGAGPEQTIVQMDTGAYTQEQLDYIGALMSAAFDPVEASIMRFDGSEASPVLLGALTFRAEDQQNFTSMGSDVPAYLNQPASHNGVFIYGGSSSIVSHVRFQAAGSAATSSPPFETGNLRSGRGRHLWRNCEFDGRRAAELDPAQPRRCGPIMANSEYSHVMEDCWMHHSNVSRYAVNDQNNEIAGQYVVRRCKLDNITNTKNTDPALNNGNSLGGWTNATPLGWESVNGTILVEGCIISQDNNDTSNQVPCHLQLTSVGSRNPQGGRLTIRDTECRSTKWTQLDEYITFRIAANTHWWTDGFDTTLNVQSKSGAQLIPYRVTGTFPPSAAALSSAGVTPETHYLVRSA